MGGVIEQMMIRFNAIMCDIDVDTTKNLRMSIAANMICSISHILNTQRLESAALIGHFKSVFESTPVVASVLSFLEHILDLDSDEYIRMLNVPDGYEASSPTQIILYALGVLEVAVLVSDVCVSQLREQTGCCVLRRIRDGETQLALEVSTERLLSLLHI